MKTFAGVKTLANLKRLKFAYARGARIQCNSGQGLADWHTMSSAPSWYAQLDYRIHPDDAHLEYGPVSTAFRDMALYTDSVDLPEIVELFMDLAGSSWPLEADTHDPMLIEWTRLFFAEWLADEGL